MSRADRVGALQEAVKAQVRAEELEHVATARDLLERADRDWA